MACFTFEVFRQGEPPAFSCVLTLSGDQRIWRQAEALALTLEDGDNSYIRVKNANGETVMRVGVATAIISIDECPCATCPLKRKLELRASGDGRLEVDLANVSPCETPDGGSC